MKLSENLFIVTGVSKGIGLAIVQSLLAQGARVAGWGRTAPPLDHPGFRFFPADVRDWASVTSALGQTLAALGQPSALVNNAGVAHHGTLEAMDPADWRVMFDTNVHGVFHCAKAVIPSMKAQGGGHILNIDSLAGKTGSEGLAGYCGSKFAVRGISEALFKEVRAYGIKVTCLMPGSVASDMLQGLPMAPPNPLRPEDVAESVLHCLQTGDNTLISELEIRPLRPQPSKSSR